MSQRGEEGKRERIKTEAPACAGKAASTLHLKKRAGLLLEKVEIGGVLGEGQGVRRAVAESLHTSASERELQHGAPTNRRPYGRREISLKNDNELGGKLGDCRTIALVRGSSREATDTRERRLGAV